MAHTVNYHVVMKDGSRAAFGITDDKVTWANPVLSALFDRTLAEAYEYTKAKGWRLVEV